MDQFVNSHDFSRFNSFINGFPSESHFILTELPPIEELFAGDHFYRIIFVPDKNGGEVGHWTVFIRYNDSDFEYFDCLAKTNGGPPQEIYDVLKDYSDRNDININLFRMRGDFMDPKNIICGKWCIARILGLPMKIPEFFDTYMRMTEDFDSPDEMLNKIFSFPVV